MPRSRRVILFCAAGAAVGLCFLGFHAFVRMTGGEIPHAHASGERLGFSTFRANERIVVQSTHGDRGVARREYLFYWAAGQRHVTVRGNRDSMDWSGSLTAMVTARPVSSDEATGLDATFRWFRRRGEEPAIGTAEYDVTYFRDNQPIGNEFFVGYGLPRDLAYLLRERAQAPAVVGPEDYDDLARSNGLTRAEVETMFPLEALEIPDRRGS